MDSEYTDYAHSRLKETIERLQDQKTDFQNILSLLAWPLACWNLLPPKFHRYNPNPTATDTSLEIHKHFPLLQRVLLQHVAAVWEQSLKERDFQQLLYQYFVPDSIYYATQSAGDVIICSYDSIMSVPFSEFSIRMLDELVLKYPIDRAYEAIWGQTASVRHNKRVLVWEDTVRNIIATPLKIANHLQGKGVPENLQIGPYFEYLCIRFEFLIYSISRISEKEAPSPPLSFLLTKLINNGLFPAVPPNSRTQRSFFETTLPIIRARIASFSSPLQLSVYSSKWSNLFSSLSITLFNTILTSFFTSLSLKDESLGLSKELKSLIKRDSILSSRLIGKLNGEDREKWQSVRAVLVGRSWNEAMARVVVCWIAEGDDGVNEEGLQILLESIVDVWTSPEHITHSLLNYHKYLTTLLLTTLSYLPSTPTSPHSHVVALSFSPPFISSIGTYIGHTDHSIRRCGMLVAEVVAQLTGKMLDFGGWEGGEDNKGWFRSLRQLMKERDIDASEADYDIIEEPKTAPILESLASAEPEIPPKSNRSVKSIVLPADNEYDSDDSLTGYPSTSTSSRSPSPTLSDLEEFERDPTLHIGKKKIHPPVYLADLGGMLRDPVKADDTQHPDKIEVALRCAEELIRRKKGFGLELEENAVNLAYGLVGLQNNYDLENFDELRQGAVNALVACCPQKAAPAMITEFFKNQYSISQRLVIMNGLALGARELASLPVPPSSVPFEKTKFPSRRLPPVLHRKLITEGDMNGGEESTVQRLAGAISNMAIDNVREATEEKATEFIRERQLRIRKPARITEVRPQNELLRSDSTSTKRMEKSTFIALAAEYFISPLLGNFWLHLRDDQEREARTAYREHTYRSTGIGLILNPIVLAQLLATVAVLMDAAMHSPHYLSILAPDALELAVTIGTRPMSSSTEEKEKEASVLTASLELALVVLDGCIDLDDGRSLSLEHTAMVMSTSEWAGNVMSLLEQGARVQGGGGRHEIRLKRAAAGVILKINKLTSKWSRSMLQYV